MGFVNDDDPIFFYHKTSQSSTEQAFDGVVTPSEAALQPELLVYHYSKNVKVIFSTNSANL
jgi:hypothetical protein